VTPADVRQRMLGFADALDAEADALERLVQGPPPAQVTQMQMQAQQAPPEKASPTRPEPQSGSPRRSLRAMIDCSRRKVM
jgi:hypothetical protein